MAKARTTPFKYRVLFMISKFLGWDCKVDKSFTVYGETSVTFIWRRK